MQSFRFHKPDYVFCGIILCLAVFGLFMLSSASAPVAISKFNDAYFYLKRQIFLGFIPGLAAFLVFLRFDYRKLKTYKWVFWGSAVILLILVFIPGVGESFGRTRSWISVGFVNFQPAEFAKLFYILFAASWLDEELSFESIKSPKTFLRYLVFFAVPALLLILQPDIGTLGVFFAISFGMIFLAGANLKHIAALILLGAFCFTILVLKAPYRAERLTIFLHPELDPQGIGYHINQAFLAIGSGGIFGVGFGQSRQKFQYLPEVAGDSIFAVIGEELGFFFASAVAILFFYLFLRGAKIAKGAPDNFGRLLVSGIIVWIAAQGFMNMGAMVGLLPLTGVPIPFISHGGTALFTLLLAAGLTGAVSRRNLE